MDSRLLFLRQVYMIERRGDVESGTKRGVGSPRFPVGEAGRQIRRLLISGREGAKEKSEANWSEARPRKTSSEYISDRTANRHR